MIEKLWKRAEEAYSRFKEHERFCKVCWEFNIIGGKRCGRGNKLFLESDEALTKAQNYSGKEQ